MNVRVLRVKRKLSQEALAAEADMDRSYLGDMERGERNPSLIALLKLSMALGCSLNDLVADVSLGVSDEPP